MMTEGVGSQKTPRVARVLLESTLPQLDHLFDYDIPDHLRSEIRVGHRVKVPFRSRKRDTIGTVIELAEASEYAGELTALTEIVSPIPLLTPDVWRLIRTVADRAAGSAADILRLVIPNRHVRAEREYLENPAGEEPPAVLDLTPQEAELASELVEGGRTSLRIDHAPVRLPDGEWVNAWARTLARAALGVQARGRSVIIVVPDYRDLDQVHDAFVAVGQHEHVRLDARQTASERYRNFLRALEERPRVILGNRSAVYAPAHLLGAILVWDDGDPSLAEPLTPYVHARDAALIRAQQTGAGLLFAAHSRSAEVQRLVNIGYVQPRELIGSKRKIIHTGSPLTGEPALARVPELAMAMMRQNLAAGPVLVQVAMRGYAPSVVCARCSDRARCHRCAGPLFSAGGGTRCRWCGDANRSWRCNTCGAAALQPRGAGSERTVEQFQRAFPETTVILSDGAHPRSRVDARPALVVATRGAEPIAAGGYRAVILLDVDTMLSAETLRAGEDAMRWWHNAVALAADGAPCVLTGGGGPIVRAFVTGRVDDWMQTELRDRAQLRFPPAVRVASLTGDDEAVSQAVETVAAIPSVDVLGPAPFGHGTVRAIIRFGYDDGAEVASRLRAELLRQISARQAQTRLTQGQRQRRGAPPGALKLRFDDRGAFDESAEDPQAP